MFDDPLNEVVALLKLVDVAVERREVVPLNRSLHNLEGKDVDQEVLHHGLDFLLAFAAGHILGIAAEGCHVEVVGVRRLFKYEVVSVR